MDSLPVADLLAPSSPGSPTAVPNSPPHPPDEAVSVGFAELFDGAHPAKVPLKSSQTNAQQTLQTLKEAEPPEADGSTSPVEALMESQEDWRSIAVLDLDRFDEYTNPETTQQASPTVPLAPTPVSPEIQAPRHGQGWSPRSTVPSPQPPGHIAVGPKPGLTLPATIASSPTPGSTGAGSEAGKLPPGPTTALGESLATTGQGQPDPSSTPQTQQPAADPRITSSRTSKPTAPASRPTASMASTPESMLFTFEFDTAASSSVARATSPTVAPSLLSQLAEASQARVPVGPAAMPNEISLVIRDPAGDIRLNVGRDERDVAVKLEVPTGLMAAVQEAEAPIRASLQDEGYKLEGFDVQEREEEDVHQAPERDRSRRHAQREQHGQGRNVPREREADPPTRKPMLGPRLLDRRA